MSFLWRGWRGSGSSDKSDVKSNEAENKSVKQNADYFEKQKDRVRKRGDHPDVIKEEVDDRHNGHERYEVDDRAYLPNGYRSTSEHSGYEHHHQHLHPEISPSIRGNMSGGIYPQRSPFERSLSMPEKATDDITLPALYSTLSKISLCLHEDSSKGTNDGVVNVLKSLHPQIRMVASSASSQPINEDLRSLLLSNSLFSILSSSTVGFSSSKSILTLQFAQCVERLTYMLRSHGLLSLSAEFSESSFQISPSDLHARTLALRVALMHSSSSSPSSSSYFALPSLFSSSTVQSPVIYLPYHLSTEIPRMAFDLSIPSTAFRLVPYISRAKIANPTSPISPSNSTFSPIDVYSLDPNALELLIRDDKRAGRRPAILVLTLGKTATDSNPFQVDNIDELSTLARRHGLWIHAEGDIVPSFAALPSTEPKPDDGDDLSSFTALVKSTSSKDVVHVSPLLVNIQSYSASTQSFLPTSHPWSFTVFVSPSTAHFPPKQSSLSLLTPTSVLTLYSFFANLPIPLYQSYFTLQSEFEQTSLTFARTYISTFLYIGELGPAQSPDVVHRSLFMSFTSNSAFPLEAYHMTERDFNTLIFEDLCTMAQSNAILAEFMSYRLQFGNFCEHTGFIYKPLSFSCFIENDLKVEQELFSHFIICVEHSIQAIHSLVKERDVFAHTIQHSYDLQIVPISALSDHCRVGIGAFRYAPRDIPEQFFEDFTSALFDILSQLPTTTRSIPVSQHYTNYSPHMEDSIYKLERTLDGHACIVVDVSPHILVRGIPSIVAEIEQEIQYIRLPDNVEKELNEALKKQAASANPVAQPSPSPRVVYAVPGPETNPEELFSQLEYRDLNELLATLHEGKVFTTFFPADLEEEEPLEDLSNNPLIQHVPLFIFYEFVQDEEHPEDPPQGALCWCEPNERYVSPQQCLPIHAISELHLGTRPNPSSFPPDSANDHCLSVVSTLITLHMEADSSKSRDDFVLALYHLLELQNQAEQAGSPSIPPYGAASPNASDHRRKY